jgi:hypothetical protein
MPNSDLPSKLYQDLFTHLHQPSTRRNSQMRNLTPLNPIVGSIPTFDTACGGGIGVIVAHVIHIVDPPGA